MESSLRQSCAANDSYLPPCTGRARSFGRAIRLIGVLIEKEGRPVLSARAQRRWLLTGGFEYNEELKRRVSRWLSDFRLWQSGQYWRRPQVGADSWAPICGICGRWRHRWATKFPGLSPLSVCVYWSDGYIIVDQNGERFCNETRFGTLQHVDGGHCLRHGIGALLAHSVLCNFRRTYSVEGPDHTGRSWRQSWL